MATLIVLIETWMVGAPEDRMPPSPNTTASSALSSASMLITTGFRAASAGVAASVAPAATSGAALSALRFHTVTL